MSEFIDAESGWSAKNDATSVNEIIFRQLERITRLASVEWYGGEWVDVPVSVGGAMIITKKYTPDTAKSYINAVDVLNDILCANYDQLMVDTVEELFRNDKDDDLLRHRKLLQAISHFLKRENYLQMQRYEE